MLNSGGTPGHVIGAIGPMLKLVAVNTVVRQRLRILPARQDRAELTAVTTLIDDGKLRPVVDRVCPLADVAAGLRQVEAGHVPGKIVVTPLWHRPQAGGGEQVTGGNGGGVGPDQVH